MGVLRIIDHVLKANPTQPMIQSWVSWRWGPPWENGPTGGRWAVYNGSETVAIRVEHDRRTPPLSGLAFGNLLNYWRLERDKEDEALRALDVRVSVPERVGVPAGASLSVPLRESVEDALAELNAKARRELDTDRYPAPENCPAPGTWVRAVRLDDDMQPEPEGKWHHVAGWNGRWGTLGVRCHLSGRNRTLNRALSPDPRWPERALLRSPEQPAEDACQRCIEGLERDSKPRAG